MINFLTIETKQERGFLATSFSSEMKPEVATLLSKISSRPKGS